MNKTLVQYGPFITILLWMETNAIILQQWHYGTSQLLAYLCVNISVTLLLFILGLLYLSKCHNRPNSSWCILTRKGIYITTIVIMVAYITLSVMSQWGIYLFSKNIYSIFNRPYLKLWLLNYGSAGVGISYILHSIFREIYILWVITIGIIQHYQTERLYTDLQKKTTETNQILTCHQAHNAYLTKTLLRELSQRIQLSLQVRNIALAQHDKNLLTLPYIIATETQWDEFLTEYNLCHNDILNQLRTDNPKLTDMDMIYLILCSMGYTPHDISLLLDTTDRTVWNRRQLVKEHLDGDVADLDEWIKEKL